MSKRRIVSLLSLVVLLLAALPATGAAGPAGQVEPRGTIPGPDSNPGASAPPQPDALVVAPPALTATVMMGDIATRTLTITNTGPAGVNVTLTTAIADDFSGESGLWTYYGSAYRDAAPAENLENPPGHDGYRGRTHCLRRPVARIHDPRSAAAGGSGPGRHADPFRRWDGDGVRPGGRVRHGQ